MLLLTCVADAPWSRLEVVPESCVELNQHDRIIEALGAWGEHPPRVDEETLARYYNYLSARLSFPFTAHYPEPRSSLEEVQHRGIVLELLDPTKYVCDEFDGILCKTRKGKYEVNLPLIELEIPEDSPNFQLIEDYWYWFWNWR
jgi:Calcium binding